MEHHEAVYSHAPEKYVTKELSPADRAAFEKHFFDCAECAEEVRLELTFAANARAVLREQRMKMPQLSWRDVWPAWLRLNGFLSISLAANAALALGFGLSLTIARRGTLQPRLVSVYFAPGPKRGPATEPARSIPPGTPALIAHIPSLDPKYRHFSYAIMDAAGKQESAGPLAQTSRSENEPYLEVPLAELPEGEHTLEVLGSPGNDIISQFAFHTSR
jgi:hypothetical protein